MYRRCIFCSADLGANEALAEFPVGRTLAFDAWKGRLWAVCPRCGRWNLAPIEERWEAVESAEKRFRDSRLRAQSGSVGLCRLPDGTRLVRVGRALPGEVAAWRYGETLAGRRRRYLLGTGLAAAGAVAVTGGVWAVGALGGAGLLLQAGVFVYDRGRGNRAVARLAADQSTLGRPFTVRRRHLAGSRLALDARGQAGLSMACPAELRPMAGADRTVMVPGEAGRALLGRGMVIANARGARPRDVEQALAHLERAGSAEAFVQRLAYAGMGLGIRRGMGARTEPEAVPMPRSEALALEMAIHERQERMALEGELAGLEAAWRQAEEIARIADALPGEPFPEAAR